MSGMRITVQLLIVGCLQSNLLSVCHEITQELCVVRTGPDLNRCALNEACGSDARYDLKLSSYWFVLRLLSCNAITNGVIVRNGHS